MNTEEIEQRVISYITGISNGLLNISSQHAKEIINIVNPSIVSDTYEIASYEYKIMKGHFVHIKTTSKSEQVFNELKQIVSQNMEIQESYKYVFIVNGATVATYFRSNMDI